MKKEYVIEDILGRMKREAFLNKILFQAEIDVTFLCNAKCFFCFQGENHTEKRTTLSFNRICALLKELRELGCFYVRFSGGEPFMRKDIGDIVRFAKVGFRWFRIFSYLQIKSFMSCMKWVWAR